MKAVSKTTKPEWWEWVVVGLLFLTAVVYAQAAQPADKESNPGYSSRTLQAIARIYMANADYDEAEKFANKALDAAINQDGAQEDTIASLVNLAWIYKNQGRFLEAERTCLLGLHLQQQLYYKDHPHIAYTLRILASIYQSQARFPEAQAALDKALSIMHKCHLADDPVVAPFDVDVARLLTAQGRFVQAEDEYERALLLISDYYGPEHLYTAAVLADIAKLYYLQNRFEESRELLDWAIEIQQKTYDRLSGTGGLV